MTLKNFVQKPLWLALLHSLVATLYIYLILTFMEKISSGLFTELGNFSLLGPMIMIMLVVISVSVMAFLFFAKPVMLYADGQKKEALKMFIFTLMWFILAWTAVFSYILLVSKSYSGLK